MVLTLPLFQKRLSAIPQKAAKGEKDRPLPDFSHAYLYLLQYLLIGKVRFVMSATSCVRKKGYLLWRELCLCSKIMDEIQLRINWKSKQRTTGCRKISETSKNENSQNMYGGNCKLFCIKYWYIRWPKIAKIIVQ